MVTSTGSLKATTSGLTDSGSPTTSSFSVTWDSSGSGSKGHGKKSPIVTVPQPASTTLGALNNFAPFVFQALRPASVALPSTTTGLSTLFNQTVTLSPLAPAPVSIPTFSVASVGGSDSPALLLPFVPQTNDPATPQTPPANADKIPAPAVQTPPSRESQDNMPASEVGSRLLLPEARPGALIGEGAEETTAVEAAWNLIFLLPLAGSCGLSRERTSERRRRPFLS